VYKVKLKFHNEERTKKFEANHVHQYYYRLLQTEVRKKKPNLTKLIFLTGIVQGFRIEGYSVPEIENCYLYIEKETGDKLICP